MLRRRAKNEGNWEPGGGGRGRTFRGGRTFRTPPSYIQGQSGNLPGLFIVQKEFIEQVLQAHLRRHHVLLLRP